MNKELIATKKREKIRKKKEARKKHEKYVKLKATIKQKKELKAMIAEKFPEKPKMTKKQAEQKTKDMEANVIFSSRSDIIKKIEEAKKKKEEKDGNS